MDLTQKIDNLSYQNTRTITIQYAIKEETMFVKSRMQDDHHDIFLYWDIDIPTHTVKAMEGRMDEKPFEDCPQSLRVLQQIVGLDIGMGVKKGFRARFLKQEGCTHISELSLATFDFIIARLYGPASGDFSEEEKHERKRQMAKFLCQNNSCTVFNQANQPHFDGCGKYKGKDYQY